MHRSLIRLPVFRMTRAAGANLVIQKHRRAMVLGREDGVALRPMALAAVQWHSSPLVVLFARLGMHALDEAEPLLVVANEHISV